MFAYGRAASMDMLLAATVTAAIGLAGLRTARAIAGRWAIPAAAAFAGLATLAKGPLGLLLPGLVIVRLRPRDPASGAGSASSSRRCPSRRSSIVAAPWYAAILLDQGQHFIDVFILGHNFQRFTSTVHHHPGPFWYYLPILLAGLFPWSGLVIPSLFGLHPRSSRPDLFVVLWLGLPLVFFSLAGSKLPGYILPCVPPLALLMGRAADRLVSSAPPDRYLSGRVTALVGLILGALVAATPAALFRLQEPLWRSAIPFGFWALAVMFIFSRRVGPDPAGALRLLRVGAGGLLVLITLVAPPILARRESGRRLFIPAMGREVLAWGAWRTAWMAGYFYNDAKVREVQDAAEILSAVDRGPTLVLVGPGEQRRLEPMGTIKTQVLARGPRENVLLRLERR